MLLFREFLNIKGAIYDARKTSLGFSRRSMPQITGDQTKSFLKYLDSEKIRYTHGRALPSDLKASQKEFNDNKVVKMLNNPRKFLNSLKPILVSSDGYVIDGHHRWLMTLIYNRINNTHIEIHTIRISKKAKPLIAMMKDFDGVMFKKVSESNTTSCATTEQKQT